MSKKERIAVARELAAMHREEARARRKRNRRLLLAGTAFGVVVILALAAWALWARYQETLAGPANMLSDGIVFTGDGSETTAVTTSRIEPGASPVATDPDSYSSYPYIVAYLDPGDADSQTFWSTESDSLSSWLTSGYIALELHLVASSGSFAEHAANALACVANSDPDDAITVLTALMTAGASDDASSRTADGVLGVVSNAGISDEDVLDCVRDDRYAAWVEAETTRAETSIPNADVDNAATLPVVLVDEVAYTDAYDDADAFLEFITERYEAAEEESSSEDSDDSTATATPTESSTDTSTDAG
ncbi:MAG: hypothetical protein QM635_01760 [Microbacteriaceae bacterium]